MGASVAARRDHPNIILTDTWSVNLDITSNRKLFASAFDATCTCEERARYC